MQSVTLHAPIGSSLHGGHRVIDVLQGGMGTVYISFQESTGQFHAIKTVRFDGPEEEVAERLRRFQEEVNNWIRVSREGRSPAIVDALAFDADERLLILEFVDGLSLQALYDHGRPIHPEHALRFAGHIAEGMDTLHTRFQLLHRDLKPQNVLVARRGLQAKVTDLGIVKSLDEETCAATRIGTPAYMAPEAFEGRADYRSDIYSYGATVYWMLTARRASVQQPADLTLVPERGRGFLEKCLAANPARRFQSFKELRAALAELEPVDLGALDGGYRVCVEHAFHTPLPESGEDVECLFCRQAHGLTEKIETAAQAVAGSLNATVPLGGASTTVAGATGTQTLGGGAASAPPRSGSANFARNVAVAIAVVVFGILGWFFFLRDATPVVDDGRDDGVERAANPPGVTKKCEHPSCDELAVSAVAFQDYRKAHPNEDGSLIADWEPRYCAAHSRFACPTCSRRELSFGQGFCRSCGETLARQ